MLHEGSIKLYLDRYCVYRHIVDGEVIYVGMGTAARAFQVMEDRQKRNDRWRKATLLVPSLEVQIVGWYGNANDARRVEREEIRRLKPPCNVQLYNLRFLPESETIKAGREKDRAAYRETRRQLDEISSVRLPSVTSVNA
jgi:hypothetical protein